MPARRMRVRPLTELAESQPSFAVIVKRRTEEVAMEKDVVCGMQVDPATAAGKSDYKGKTYYFCSAGCKTKFDANPSQYVK